MKNPFSPFGTVVFFVLLGAAVIASGISTLYMAEVRPWLVGGGIAIIVLAIAYPFMNRQPSSSHGAIEEKLLAALTNTRFDFKNATLGKDEEINARIVMSVQQEKPGVKGEYEDISSTTLRINAVATIETPAKPAT